MVSLRARAPEGRSGCPLLWAWVTLHLRPQRLPSVQQFACPRQPLAVTMATTAHQADNQTEQVGVHRLPCRMVRLPRRGGEWREQRSAPKVLPSNGPKDSPQPPGRAAFGCRPHPVQTLLQRWASWPPPTARPPGVMTTLVVTARVMSGSCKLPCKIKTILSASC